MLAASCAGALPAFLAAAVATVVKDVQERTGRKQQERQYSEQVRAVLRDQEVSRNRGESEERDFRYGAQPPGPVAGRMLVAH
jgi:hypothetical protein